MRNNLFIFLTFLFFTFLFTFPSVFHLSNQIIGDGGDNYQFLGFQYIANRQLNNCKFPFSWTDYWRYPVGFDFSSSYDSPLFILIGLLFYQIIDNPIIVYNLSVLTLLFLNGIISYPLFKKVTNSTVLGIVGALIYGFSFYNIARLGGHPNLILTSCFPLFVYSLINIKEKQGDIQSYYVFTFSVILVFLSSLQYFLILVGSIILFFPIFIIFYNKLVFSYLNIFWKKYKFTIYSILTIITSFLFFNLERLYSFLTKSLILFPKEYVQLISPNIIDFFLPNTYLPLIINSNFLPNILNLKIEKSLFLGYIEIVILICFFFSKNSKKIKIFLLSNILFFLIISLGYKENLMHFYPYYYLFKIFPFRGVTEAGRFYIILYLFTTIAVLLALKNLSSPSKKMIITLIIVLLILERLPSKFYLSNIPENEKFIYVVKNLKSEAVLDLPTINQWDPTNQKNIYNLYSVYYQKPIVNGYIHWTGDTIFTESFLNILKDFECGTDTNINMLQSYKIAQVLRNNNIQTIVFHKYLTTMNNKVMHCNQAIKNINFFLLNSELKIDRVYEDNLTSVFQLQ